MRVKLGTHELEVEGREEVVAAHFKTWQQLILTRAYVEPTAEPAPAPGIAPVAAAAAVERNARDLFTVDAARRTVALRLYPGGETRHADAALRLLHGYRLAFGEAVPNLLVTRLKAALAASGHRAARIDRTLAPHLAQRLVRKAGRRIGSTYELTQAGAQRANSPLKNSGAQRIRHSRGSGNPVFSPAFWTPAFAGVTVGRLFQQTAKALVRNLLPNLHPDSRAPTPASGK